MWREVDDSGRPALRPSGAAPLRVAFRFAPGESVEPTFLFRWFASTSTKHLYLLNLVEGGGCLRASCPPPLRGRAASRRVPIRSRRIGRTDISVPVVRIHLNETFVPLESGGGRWMPPGVLPSAPPGPRRFASRSDSLPANRSNRHFCSGGSHPPQRNICTS